MDKRIFIIGAGAVGAYTGGHLARSGVDITLVDPWEEHVQKMRTEGLSLRGMSAEESCEVKMKAMTPYEFSAVTKNKPVDIAVISTKSYDTQWAVDLIAPALSPSGFVISLQNCINEERIAAVVGGDRTAGCIASTISVDLKSPAFVQRNVPKRGDEYTVFRCGELSGEMSERVAAFVNCLQAVDSAKQTSNLLGERWSKLTINASHNGLSASTGYDTKEMATIEAPRRLSIRLSAETIKVAQGLGVTLEIISGFTPEEWVGAASGATDILERIEAAKINSAKERPHGSFPSMGQDIKKGRRTEIDYLNGLVVEQGKVLGIPTPANAGIWDAVRRVENGNLKQDPKNIDNL